MFNYQQWSVAVVRQLTWDAGAGALEYKEVGAVTSKSSLGFCATLGQNADAVMIAVPADEFLAEHCLGLFKIFGMLTFVKQSRVEGNGNVTRCPGKGTCSLGSGGSGPQGGARLRFIVVSVATPGLGAATW